MGRGKSPARQAPPNVVQVASCVLTTSNAAWPYAEKNQAAIAAHWRDQAQLNPAYFNGPVWLMSRWDIGDDATLRATFLRTDFRSYLFWRHRGFEQAGVWDAFGSGVVRTSDGAVLLGEQNPGHVNAGACYPPAGLIDDSDAALAQPVDIDASIAREIGEETGLDVSHLNRQPGYWVTTCGLQIAISVLFDSPAPSKELAEEVRRFLAQQPDPELAKIHMVRTRADIARLTMPDYARYLVETLVIAPPVLFPGIAPS